MKTLAILLGFLNSCSYSHRAEKVEIKQEGNTIDYHYRDNCHSSKLTGGDSSKKFLYTKVSQDLESVCGGRGYRVLSEEYSDCEGGKKEALLKLQCK